MNIFEITNDFKSIYNTLEENGGELTPELEEALEVTQNNFKSKVEGYAALINKAKLDITGIDKEIDRLKEYKDARKSIIDRLTKILVNAIDEFGDTNKNGVKFVDYGTGKVSVAKSNSVEVDEETVKNTVKLIFRKINLMKEENQLDTIDELSLVDFVNDCINNTNEDGDIEPIPIDINDINGMNATVSFNLPIKDLFKNSKGLDIIRHLAQDYNSFDAKPNINKTQLKFELGKEETNYSFARLKENKSIRIK